VEPVRNSVTVQKQRFPAGVALLTHAGVMIREAFLFVFAGLKESLTGQLRAFSESPSQIGPAVMASWLLLFATWSEELQPRPDTSAARHLAKRTQI